MVWVHGSSEPMRWIAAGIHTPTTRESEQPLPKPAMNDHTALTHDTTEEAFSAWLAGLLRAQPRLRARMRDQALQQAVQQFDHQGHRLVHDLKRREANAARLKARIPLSERSSEPELMVAPFGGVAPPTPHLVMAALLECWSESREGSTRQTGEVIPSLIGEEDGDVYIAVLAAVHGLHSLDIGAFEYLRTVVEGDVVAVGGTVSARGRQQSSSAPFSTRKKMPRGEAQLRARNLLDEDPSFKDKSVREWAKRIGCSTGQVGNLAAWKAVRENRPATVRRPTAIPLQGKTLDDAAAPDTALDRLAQEIRTDFEPSPLWPDYVGRRTRVKARRQV